MKGLYTVLLTARMPPPLVYIPVDQAVHHCPFLIQLLLLCQYPDTFKWIQRGKLSVWLYKNGRWKQTA